MKRTLRVYGIALLHTSALFAADTRAQANRIESFEDALPPGIVAEGGKVTTSDEDCQDGLHALRWDFTPGGKLILPTGPLGNIGVWTGYGGYSRSAFEMRIRTIEAPGGLTCRFMAGDQVGGSFTVPLVFDGWQRVCYHLSWRSRLKNRRQKVLAQTDRFVIEAPAEGKGGTVYLDLVCFNRPIDFRGKREAIRERWKPFDPRTAPAMADLLTPPTEDELAALRYFLEQDRGMYPSGPAKDADVARLEQVAKERFLLRRLPNGKVRGRGLSKWHPLTGQMLAVAKHWLHTDDPALRQRLEDLFFLQNDFLRQQGGVAQGAIQGLNWYGGRNHADACYIMREPLRRTGRLPTVSDCLRYNYGYRNIFKTGRGVESMDYYYTAVRYLFKIALMQERPEDIVLHLRAFSRRLSRQLVDTIKPDGSCYHHGFHYFAYAGGATRMMASQLKLMAPTPFRVTREAYGKVKLAFMNMRWYANVRDLPLTLHGRHPGRQSLSPHGFLALAEAGRPYHDGKLDTELVRAGLRLAPELRDKEPYAGAGLEPEPAPTGHLTMPYAGLTSHRRGGWLAMVRGYGRYLAAQESYSNTNRHGLFFANGYLDILTGGNPVNIFDSGCRANQGWDWRRLDGTTVIYMPYAKMANGHGTMSERSRETFVGGLTRRGRNGLFMMTLNSGLQYRKALPEGKKPVKEHAFRGKKTYFFFDGRIVCLGSNIENHDSPFPVQTNLFQKFLPAVGRPEDQKVETGSPGKWTRRSVSYRAKANDAGHPLFVNLASSRNLSTGVIGWDKATVSGGTAKLVNGDFEEGRTGEAPAGWTYTDLPDKGDHSFGVRPSGDRTAGKRVSTEDGRNWLSGGRSAVFSQKVLDAMVAGETYEFSVLVQSAGSSYARSRVYFSTALPASAEQVRPAAYAPIMINDRVVQQLPFKATLPTDCASLLMDTQNTGYYAPAGQPLHVSRLHQKSRDGHDKKDTEGHYAAAWLEHGVNPKDASYEYVVMPNTTPESLATFGAAMADEKTPPYRVLQRDGNAHIVLDRTSRTWGCVFFAEQELVSAIGLPVKGVLQPCLLMAQQTGRGIWQMSLADPDLNLGKGGISQPKTVRLLLPGRWRLLDAPGNIKLTPATDGDSLLTAKCSEGRSHDFGIARNEPVSQ